MEKPMNRQVSLLLVVFVTAAAASVAAQGQPYRAARTESGQPDLQGVWNFNSHVPLQRPAASGGKKVFTKDEAQNYQTTMRNALGMIAKFAPVEDVGFDWMDNRTSFEDLRTSLITYPDSGRLAALQQGVRRMPGVEDFLAVLSDPKGNPSSLGNLLAAFGGGKRESHRDFPLSARCVFGADVPMVPGLDDNFVQIVQSRDHVVIINDVNRRIVTLETRLPAGERPAADGVRSWSGTSRGRWEGETLVVETRNFDGCTSSFGGAGNSREKVVTERFTRTAKDRLDCSASVVDAKTFQDRVELSFPMGLADAQIYESACHEHNYSLRDALTIARGEDARK
jgi:hypothetical protein